MFSTRRRISAPQFLYAAKDGNLETVKRYIKQNKNKPDKIDVRDSEGRNAIMLAAGNPCLKISAAGFVYNDYSFDLNLAIIDYILLKVDINLNATDSNGDSALMLATYRQAEPIIRNLLEAGADINTTNRKGRTPFLEAIYQHDTWNNYLNISDLLLKLGAEVNNADTEGKTALMIASANTKLTIIQRLLRESNLALDATDQNGNTALTWACSAPYLSCIDEARLTVKFLLKAGAQVNISNRLGRTALMNAAYRGVIQIVHLLLEAGAKINEADQKGNTALIYSIANEQTKVTLLLIEAKADLNQANVDGDTPLIIAVRKENQVIIEKLLERGADLSIANKKGETAKSLANNSVELRECIYNSLPKGKLHNLLEALEFQVKFSQNQNHTQELLAFSFFTISQFIQFIQEHSDQMQDLNASKDTFLNFATLLFSLGQGFSREDDRKIFDDLGLQLMQVAARFGQESAINIVSHFNKPAIAHHNQEEKIPETQATFIKRQDSALLRFGHFSERRPDSMDSDEEEDYKCAQTPKRI